MMHPCAAFILTLLSMTRMAYFNTAGAFIKTKNDEIFSAKAILISILCVLVTEVQIRIAAAVL